MNVSAFIGEFLQTMTKLYKQTNSYAEIQTYRLEETDTGKVHPW